MEGIFTQPPPKNNPAPKDRKYIYNIEIVTS